MTHNENNKDCGANQYHFSDVGRGECTCIEPRDYATKRLEEFEKEFKDWCFNHHHHLGRMFDRKPVDEYVKSFLSETIHQAEQEMLKTVLAKVFEKVKEYHKISLTDMFINGKFWAYKEMGDDLLDSLSLTDNK